MKHISLRRLSIIITLGILIFIPCRAVSAMELEIIGGANWVTFDQKPDELMPLTASDEFVPYRFFFGKISLKNDLSDFYGYNIRIIRDNILQNNLEGLFFVKTDNFEVHAGPFLGMINDLESAFLGVMGSIEIRYPGVVFLEVSGSATLGKDLDLTGGHSRETFGIRAGVWLPSLIPSFNMSIKRFTREIDSEYHIQDSLTRFYGSFDYYTKNSPMILRVNAGYQVFSRLYEDSSTNPSTKITDEMDTIFGGAEIEWQWTNNSKVVLGAEIPLYINAKAPMEVPSILKMPKITAGFIYSFR